MRNVIGIDPSLTNTGLVRLRDDGVYTAKLFKSSPLAVKCMKNRIGRAVSLAEQVVEYITTYREDGDEVPHLVLLEGYSYGSPASAHTIGEFGGFLRAKLLRHLDGDTVVEVAPATLKQFATGKGNAKKLAVATAIVKRYGCDFGGSDDLYDAFALAKLAACVIGWDEPANAGQGRAVAKIWSMEETAVIK